MCLGRRPIPIGAEIARSTDQEAGKVALGPSATEADAHTFASLRSLQPRVVAARTPRGGRTIRTLGSYIGVTKNLDNLQPLNEFLDTRY